MNFCTVVIPTLELSLRSTDFIVKEIEDNSKLVSRLIFINNNIKDTFTERYKNFKKVEVISNQKNLYVNPAWNYGMSLVATKYYGIINDDVYFNGQLIDDIIRLLDNNDNLNLTTVETTVDYDQEKIVDLLKNRIYENELKYEVRTYPNEIKQGWFLIGRTKDWIPIDCGLTGDIMKGDDQIYLDNQKKYAGACLIKNNRIFHLESSSVRKLEREKEFYQGINK